MKTEFGVIQITEPPLSSNNYYEDVKFFVGIVTDEDGSIKYTSTSNPCAATEIRNASDRDNRKVQELIALIKTMVPKCFKVEHKTVKISIE
jgi:hypothetical protein